MQQKIISNQKFGNKKICVITGTSSGLGKQTAKALLQTGEWHVIGAVRDLDKMSIIAEDENFDKSSFTAMQCDLASFASVRQFVQDLMIFKSGQPLERLICNAAVYQPTLNYAKYTEDDIEQQVQINHLSHFLLTSLLIQDLREAKQARVLFVGSVTGNDNTVGGGGVYPIADLRELEGLEAGMKKPIEMIDGYRFNGAKAYKDR
jgi:protochlorophyllide reductase